MDGILLFNSVLIRSKVGKHRAWQTDLRFWKGPDQVPLIESLWDLVSEANTEP